MDGLNRIQWTGWGGKRKYESKAVMSGVVIDWQKKKNELTGNAYYWALLDTYYGQVDVVTQCDFLNPEPVTGGVLWGSFWLSGILISE